MAVLNKKIKITITAEEPKQLSECCSDRVLKDLHMIGTDNGKMCVLFLSELIGYLGGGITEFSCGQFEGGNESECFNYEWRLYNDDFSIYRKFISKNHLWQPRVVICDDVTNVACRPEKYKIELNCAGYGGLSKLELMIDGVSEDDSTFIFKLTDQFFKAVKKEKNESECFVIEPGAVGSADNTYAGGSIISESEELLDFADIYDAAKYGGLNAVEKYINMGAPVDEKNTESKTPLFIVCERFDERAEIAGYLLKLGANARTGNQYKQPALLAASKNGHAEIVKMLLNKGAKPQTADIIGTLSLHSAAAEGYTDVVNVLIEAGALPDVKDGDKYTALHRAVMNGHLETVVELVKNGAGILKKDSNGNTAVDLARKFDFLEIASFLEEYLNNRPDKFQSLVSAAEKNNAVSDDSQENCRLSDYKTIKCRGKKNEMNLNSELIQAAARADYIQIKKLLDAGADINYRINNGQNALIAAASKICSDIKALKLLIESGSDIDAKDKHGNTALIYAAEKNNLNAVKELILAGCDINHQNNNGETALYIAAFYGAPEACEYLVEHGADLEKTARYKRTALIAAAAKSDIKTALFLIERGAEINIFPASGWNALMYAVYNGLDRLAEELLKRGAAVNFKNNSGETPLMEAVNKKNKYLIDLLLKAGADPEVKDSKGRTAVDIAVESWYNEEIIKMIAEKCGQGTRDKVNAMKFVETPRIYAEPVNITNDSNSSSSIYAGGDKPPLPDGFKPSIAFIRFYESFFGSAYMAWHDGLDLESVNLLEGYERELAEKLLLEHGDHRASQGLGQLRSLKSADRLKENLKTASAQEIVNTALALKKIENDDKYCENIIDVLKNSKNEYDKLEAAMALRHFRTRESITALYDAVCDEHYLVRYHACDSLLILHGMGSDIYNYKEIFNKIIAGKTDAPVTPCDRRRFREAAKLLKKMFEK